MAVKAVGRRPRWTGELDHDQPGWLAKRARELSTSQATVVRQLIRAAQNAEGKSSKRGAA